MASPRIARTAAEISAFLVTAERDNRLLAVNDQGHVTYAGRKTQFLHSLKSTFGNSASRDERIRQNHALIATVLQNKIAQEYGGGEDVPSQKRFELINNTLISIIKPEEKTNPHWKLPAQRLAQFFSQDLAEIDRVALPEFGRMHTRDLIREEAIQITSLFVSKPPHPKLLALFDGSKSSLERKNILNAYLTVLKKGINLCGNSYEEQNLQKAINMVLQSISLIADDRNHTIDAKVFAATTQLAKAKTELALKDQEISELEKKIPAGLEIQGGLSAYDLQGAFLKQQKEALATRFQEKYYELGNFNPERIEAEKELVAAESKYDSWSKNYALAQELDTLHNIRKGAVVDVLQAQDALARSQKAFLSDLNFDKAGLLFGVFTRAQGASLDARSEQAFAISLEKGIPFEEALKVLAKRQAIQMELAAFLPKDVVLPLVDGQPATLAHDFTAEELTNLAEGIVQTHDSAKLVGNTGMSISFEKDAERNHTFRCEDASGTVTETATLEGSVNNLIKFCNGDRAKAATLSTVLHQGAFASALIIDAGLLQNASGDYITPQTGGMIQGRPIFDLKRVEDGQIQLNCSYYNVNRALSSSAGTISINPQYTGNPDVEDLQLASPDNHTYGVSFEVLLDEQQLAEGKVVARAGQSGQRTISISADWDQPFLLRNA